MTMLDPLESSNGFGGIDITTRDPFFRSSNHICFELFKPLIAIDRAIRPDYWGTFVAGQRIDSVGMLGDFE